MEKNIHNNQDILNMDSDVIKVLEEAKEKKLAIYAAEADFYHDMFLEYDKFITLLVKLLKSLNLHTTFEYSIAIKYLIDNGYLSKNMQFYPKEASNELELNCGPNIIVGYGVCRNYADFHKDVMNGLKEYVKQFYCAKTHSLRKAQSAKANHVLNLIKYNDSLYGIDLANGASIYKFINGYMLQEISFTSNSILLYKPYFEMIAEMHDFEDIRKSIKLFQEDSLKNHILPLEYYDDILPKVKSILVKEKNTFIDFHNETKVIKDNIAEAMSRKRVL